MSPDLHYAELHCLTNFTFLRGASHPEEQVARAAELGYGALAITDECSLAGVVRAHGAAKHFGLKLIIGSEVRLEDGPRLVLLATDREGYGNLSELITLGRRRAEKGAYRLTRADLADGLPGCLALLIPAAQTDGETAGWVAGAFPGRAWLAVELLQGPDDAGWLEHLEALGRAAGLPRVAAGDVHMHRRGRRALQDLVTAIRHGVPLKEAGHALHPNGERHLRPLPRLARLYPPALLAESMAIAARCTFSLEELRYNYPTDFVPPGQTPAAYLRRLTEAGMAERWPQGVPQKVRALVEHELAIIAELNYEPYFLAVHDIVQFARSRGILCQGRGSAANSAVCFSLGITAVDPSRMEMLFERFISKERNEPPDIDVDFEHQRREEVFQYIFETYGRQRAAIAATVITYRTRSAVRDVGKALGMDLGQVERLAGTFTWWDGRNVDPERIREAGFDPENPQLQRLIALVRELRGFPRHLSQHVGGFVITRDRLSRLVPIENAAMPAGPAGAKGHEAFVRETPAGAGSIELLGEQERSPNERPCSSTDHPSLEGAGPAESPGEALDGSSDGQRPSMPPQQPLEVARTVIQWDKDDLDAMGLLKVDCLALGMLSAIHRAFGLLEKHRGRRLTLAEVPPEDPAVYAMIQKADTIGVFQIESRAQMSMLPRLKPRTFYDLVIEVAIIRPGPIQGGMIHPYLRRRQGLEPVTYPSPAVKDILARTLGVPIFQEQVIKLAMVAAGFSAGEADQLRRAMAAWRRKGDLLGFEQKLREGMHERGYSEAFAEQIFNQIQGFGEYGFPESHAASFALLVYVSAWIKCHEPAVFACALLNSQPMGFYAPSQLVQDARRHGVEVRPVDARVSDWDCTLEKQGQKTTGKRQVKEGLALRLGLRMVRGLSRAGGFRLVAARLIRPFVDVQDLRNRARLNRADMEALAAAGALEGMAGDRHQARWQVLGTEETLPLFEEVHEVEPPAPLPAPSAAEDLVADYHTLGLTLGPHPLALLREQLRKMRFCTAEQSRALRNGALVRTAGLVITRQRPGNAGGVTFLTLEDETGISNVVVWPDLAERQRKELIGARLLGIYGQLQKEGEVIHVIAKRLVDHSQLLGDLSAPSRDFH